MESLCVVESMYDDCATLTYCVLYHSSTLDWRRQGRYCIMMHGDIGINRAESGTECFVDADVSTSFPKQMIVVNNCMCERIGIEYVPRGRCKQNEPIKMIYS
eukprot:scaffold22712_cov138-Amphora_coffeaeformis.AAC.1